jgi:GNAT superfamily N-acetyltransferase
MYIQESHRHKGLGAQILNHSINLARVLGYEKIRLDTVTKWHQPSNFTERKDSLKSMLIPSIQGLMSSFLN